MRDLHWLPIAKRIDYKIALTTFKVLSNDEPAYLHSLLKTAVHVRSLRSSDRHLLVKPFCKSVLASRAFSCFAPTLWNNLPNSLRNCVSRVPGIDPISVDAFKRRLKTFLFNAAYNGRNT